MLWEAQAQSIWQMLSNPQETFNNPDHLLGSASASNVQHHSKTLTDLITVDNSDLFHNLRSAYAGKRFTRSTGERWLRADLTSNSRKLRALAQLKPDPQDIEPLLSNSELLEWEERTAAYISSMDDLTADVLDAIIDCWLKGANHPEAMVTMKADDFLRYRGLKPQKSKTGRRGGYKDSWRRKISLQINTLHDTWITVFQRQVTDKIKGKRKRTLWEGESRAIVISSRFGQRICGGIFDSFVWRLRPGDVFGRFLLGPGRQTAILSQKALYYDPYRQRWEKRLTRYLAYIWRIRQSRRNYTAPFSVAVLLKAIDQEMDQQRPNRTRKRLEKALDQLQHDKVIASWHYESGADANCRTRWWREWLAQKVLIEPPLEIVEFYARIPRST